MRKFLLTLLAAVVCAATVWANEIKWTDFNQVSVSTSAPYIKKGVVLQVNTGAVVEGAFANGNYTFRIPSGHFAGIEINFNGEGIVDGFGWLKSERDLYLWSGWVTEVTFDCEIDDVTEIVFYIEPDDNEVFGSCGDNLAWNLNKITGTLTIFGTGAMDDYALSGMPYSEDSAYTPNTAPWASYWKSIKNVVIEEGVTSVGQYAFYGYQAITSVTLPSTLTIIKKYAFSNCSKLPTVHFPEGLETIGEKAFEECTGLTSIDFPSTLTTLEMFAFLSCTGLTSIDLPSSVQTIGHYVFQNCTKLTDVMVHWTSLDGISVGKNPFNAVKTANVKLHVPFGTAAIYAAASPWSNFDIKSEIMKTCPTAINDLVYTGNAQALVIAGTPHAGTLKYSINNTDWSADVPSVTNAGDYTVYYKVYVESLQADVTPENNTVAVSIAKAPLTITADSVEVTYGNVPVYTVSYLGFLGDDDESELSDTWTFDCAYEVGSDIGDYIVTPGGVTSGNYDITFLPGVLTVQKAEAYITQAPIAKTDLVADGTAQELIETGQWVGGEMQYKVNHGEWNSAIPTATEPGGYVVFYKVAGDMNHYDDPGSYVVLAIEKQAGEYTVTFKAEDGEVLSTEQVDLHFPEAPIVAEKTFKGWIVEQVDENDLVLRAVYEAGIHTQVEQVTNDPSALTNKVVRDGQMIIIQGVHEYNAQGKRVK